jgi:uncharacterized membrane protein YGL010W/DNA-binding transcriptional LysR family regulator
MAWIVKIHVVDIRSLDLNLLVVFDALAEHASVTRGALAIGLSQPAMSAALARLRGLFGDPLFVKIGARMQPTPLARELIAPVRQVIAIVKADVLRRPGFDPATTERTFTLLTPDVGEVNLLPRLLARMRPRLPRARLRCLSLQRDAAAAALEAGTADLAIGLYPDLSGAGYFRQRLFATDHACIAARDHPGIGARLTLKQYLALDHVVVRPDGREPVIERHLAARGLKRRVFLEVGHFMSLLPIVEQTELLATARSACSRRRSRRPQSSCCSTGTAGCTRTPPASGCAGRSPPPCRREPRRCERTPAVIEYRPHPRSPWEPTMKTGLEQLTKYAEYHRDRRNIATHLVGVPMIVFSVTALLSRPAFELGGVPLNAAWVATALAGAYYLLLDARLGLALTAIIGLMCWASVAVAAQSTAVWLTAGAGLFVVGWIIQFIGHYYEGRKPAFVDDILGLLIGPLFVLAEVAFALGLRKGLERAIEARVGPTHLRDLGNKPA